MEDLLEEFIAETRDTLELLSEQLVQWEKTPSDLALIDSAFRFVHTVKGSCGFLELPRLLRLSHAAEDLLSNARDGRLSVTSDLVTAVLRVIDRIAILTDVLETGQPVFDDDAMLIDAMLAFVQNIDLDKHQVAAIGEEYSGADNDQDGLDVPFERSKSRSVRVSLSLLDTLMGGVSDMVLARNEVSRQLRMSGGNAALEGAFVRLSASVAEMRDAVGQMRMQNIERLFSSLPRLVRDIAQELGKQIDLHIEGSEVEIDREMVEALRDPLTHILRNAADHGIENADIRSSLGKDPMGHIRVAARQSGNQIIVEIVDDGNGIDLDKLAVRAIAAKLTTDAAWQKMSERSKLDMIFSPGLSTAENVSAISGRGVGMDVVRTNIQSVGGTIELENHPSQGLKMTLRLPLTLSIIAGLSVKAGDQIFGISRSSVIEILSVSNANVEMECIGGRCVARIRGTRYPYAKLEELLGLNPPTVSQEMRPVLIVMRAATGNTFALEVADVFDNEELVIRPCAPIVMASGLYAGTTLPDNGRPMLLLDASGIAVKIGLDQVFDTADEVDVSAQDQNTFLENARAALLFINTGGKRQAIRLSVIERMEDIAVENISYSGGLMRVCQGGSLVEISGLNKVPDAGAVQALRLTDGQTSHYLAVQDVLDIFTIEGEIFTSALPDLHEGIVQTNDGPVELINFYHFFEAPFLNHRPSVQKPLCFIDCVGDNHWEQGILQPLLLASGYAVSFDENDRAAADIVLGSDGIGGEQSASDTRILRLRDNLQATPEESASVYRYDRLGLLAAIELKLMGQR